MTRISLALLACLCLGLPSLAAAQQMHAAYGNWKVFTYLQGKEKLCYIMSAPLKKGGTVSKRADPFVLVTHRKATLDEVSISSGYPFKSGSEVVVNIGGESFRLFTKGERAWAYDEDQDNRLVAAMAKGNTMQIKGSADKAGASDDSYALSGFSKAHAQMKALCR